MSTGTLTLTQNSTAVVGSGTLFTTELEIGGVIYVSLSGVNHTLVVSSITSNTQLTLARGYTGATQSGITWTAIPRDALVGIHAQLAADNAWSRRAAVLDKQNWNQVFTGAGTITVTLPDGSTFSGPSWAYLVSTMATKIDGAVPIAQGGTGATTKEGARTNLDLGSSATKDVGKASGNVMQVGAFGLGASVYDDAPSTPAAEADANYMGVNGIFAAPGTSSSNYASAYAPVMIMTRGTSIAQFQVNGIGGVVARYRDAGSWSGWATHYHTNNTTKASDGTLKAASPVVQIFNDGGYQLNDESKGCTATRVGVGQYLIEGCTGLNADAAWGGIDGGFDVPTDRNKQPLIWLDYEVNADGSVLVKTYHRTHPEAPAFARNLIGYKNDVGEFIETIANGDPVDIPSDQFVSVRVEMPENSIWNQRQIELAEVNRIALEISSEEE